MPEQTPPPTLSIANKAYSEKPRLTQAETDELLSKYDKFPQRVPGIDSHFFRSEVPIKDQSWHQGGVLGLPFANKTNNVMTDISKLKFKSTCPQSGNYPPPKGITAVLSDQAVITYTTTQNSIQTAKAVYFPPVRGGSETAVRQAIFVMKDGIYKVQDLDIDHFNRYSEDFARTEANATLGPDAKGLEWTNARSVTFHKLKVGGEEGAEEDESEAPYVPEDLDELSQLIQ